MSTNFFSDEDASDDVFRDIPEETVEGDRSPPVRVKMQQTIHPRQELTIKDMQKATSSPVRPTQQELEDETYETSGHVEESFDDEDDDFTSVLNDARLRLEQGRLYETVMNHELFQNFDADPKAIKNVQKEIRKFAKERMEIMLGMRQEQRNESSLGLILPFNELEVEVLKRMASTFTKGATDITDSDRYIAPVIKQSNLNPIASNIKLSKPSSIKSAKPSKPLQNKPAEPIKRTQRDAEIERILAEEGVSREELERTFDPNYRPLNKPLEQLTPEEIMERNKQISKKTKVVPRPHNALPMPTQEQEEAMYTVRAQQASANPQMQSIMTMLNNAKKK